MRIFIAIACILISSASFAQTFTPETTRVSACPITPAVGAIAYPGKARIPTTNSLIRPEGKADDAGGQKLYVMARVLDTNCVPLQDVSVEIWQADPFSKLGVASPEDLATPQAMFAGAGKTYTQNDGSFTVATLFPGPLRFCARADRRGRCIQFLERAPFINIRISGAPLKAPFMGSLFFENDRRNATDPVYKRLSADNQKRVTMRVLPFDGSDFNNGMKSYLEIIVPTGAHFHGY